MSVRPIGFQADGSITAVHDEAGHGGVVAFADIAFGRKVDGTVDLDFLVVPCPFPGCNSVSLHPVGGGAAPGVVQLLFIRTLVRRAVALGFPVAQRSFTAIKARVRARAEALDGPGRFRLDAIQSEDDTVPDEAQV